jgi:hypothetical protein
MEFISQDFKVGSVDFESNTIPLHYIAGEKRKWSYLK